MKPTPNPLTEPYRLPHKVIWGTRGNNGAFQFPNPTPGQPSLRVVASNGQGSGWEHVSVSTATRCPTWDEMCYIKSLFWRDREAVVQYHPPKDDNRSYHPFCLHLWRPVNGQFPMPDPDLVAPAKGETMQDTMRRRPDNWIKEL